MPGLGDKAEELCQEITNAIVNADEMMSQASTRPASTPRIEAASEPLQEALTSPSDGADVSAHAAPSPGHTPARPQRLLFSGGSGDASARRRASSTPLLGDSLDLSDSPARAAEDLVKYHGRRAKEDMNQLLAYVQKKHLREMNEAALMHRRLMIGAGLVILTLFAILGAIVVSR